MMLPHAICALLFVLVDAAAFRWSLPEQTVFAPAADVWSPAPTAPPAFDLFRRQLGEGSNTCAYLSGSQESSITCLDTNLICATNSRFGVHGCCPQSMSGCVLPTRCVASTAMSASCDDFCSTNPAVVRCTQAQATECYTWLIHYPTTIMKQLGCTDKGFTSEAQRYWNMSSTVPNELWRTATVTVQGSPSASPTLTPPGSSKPGIGVIVGATIGGCVFLSGMALAVFFIYRKRKIEKEKSARAPPATRFYSGTGSVTEYDPNGFHTTYVANDQKNWQQQGPVYRANNVVPQYPGMNIERTIVEADGMQRPVEAPTDLSIPYSPR